MYYALGLIVFVLICLAVIYSPPAERLISEPSYLLLSRGLNLPATGGSYLGGIAVINAAENANTVSDVSLAY